MHFVFISPISLNPQQSGSKNVPYGSLDLESRLFRALLLFADMNNLIGQKGYFRSSSNLY